jgi:hypothetical protein
MAIIGFFTFSATADGKLAVALMRRFLYKEAVQLPAGKGVVVAKKSGVAGAVMALSIFIFGGILTFVGLGLIAFMKNRPLFTLGEGRSFGILLFCVGLLSSIMGVLVMRLVRNRV